MSGHSKSSKSLRGSSGADVFFETFGTSGTY
jgi:hypothetical protein